MSIKKLFLIGFISLVSIFSLTACAGDNDETSPDDGTDVENTDENSEAESDPHANMDHSSSGEVPGELAIAENPTYPEGSQAVMYASHMEGMDEAIVTIEGAFDTTAYTVTYTPTNGGEKVENHKRVTESELSSVE